MNLEQLREELSGGRLRGGYLLAGPEPLLRDDALAALRSAVLEGGPEDFNYDRLDAARTRPPALVDALRTLPVMATRRLVALRDADAGRGAKALLEVLPDALEHTDPERGSVLVVTATKADGRAKWVKAFGDAKVACEAPRQAREAAAFVLEEAERQGVALEKAAAALLADRIGPQLLMLRQEIAKTALLAGDGKKVTRAHVAAAALDVAEDAVWDLTDAIGEGRTEQAAQPGGRRGAQRAAVRAPQARGAGAALRPAPTRLVPARDPPDRPGAEGGRRPARRPGPRTARPGAGRLGAV